MTRILGVDNSFQVMLNTRAKDPYNLSFKVTHIFKDTEKSRAVSLSHVKHIPTGSTLIRRPIGVGSERNVKRSDVCGSSSKENPKSDRENETQSADTDTRDLHLDLFAGLLLHRPLKMTIFSGTNSQQYGAAHNT
ncbi:conserved hypothetical protein [Ricinus communis]|uniref:Uncharacterized protein n=1 Tax=Ricinus communis TaxID=3988 RepID=B9T6G5_RICCO|nr:conserved hypothetical protein [Ricinus communis]